GSVSLLMVLYVLGYNAENHLNVAEFFTDDDFMISDASEFN
ncbi:3571_t:CDS:1, partial [Funneliformis caledonium]